MYRRHSDEIRELRKRGLPWLASAVLLLLLLIFGISIFIVLENQNSSKKNLLFRWKHGSFEDYDDDEGKTGNESIIYITPLRKHGDSDELSSTEDAYLLLSSTTDSSFAAQSTLPPIKTKKDFILLTRTTTVVPTLTASLPMKVESNDASPTFSENITEDSHVASIPPKIFPSIMTPSVTASTLNSNDGSNLLEKVLFSTTSYSTSTASPETSTRYISSTTLLTPTLPIVTTPLTSIPTFTSTEKAIEAKPNLEISETLVTSTISTILPTDEKSGNSVKFDEFPIPTETSKSNNDSPTVSYSKAAVSSSDENCSEIGRNILLRGGNSVDAAIATDFCMGAMHPHKAGLGGSTVMLIYQPGLKPVVLDGVATSPRSATFNTFAFNPISSKKGYSSIACPGNLAALWNAYNRYGSRKLKWQDLILPTIDILDRGFEPSEELFTSFSRLLGDQKLDPIVRKRLGGIFTNRTTYRNDPLAQTLRKLASSRDPYQLFYRGDVASQITQEIRSLGAILTKLDFINYVANIEEAIIIKLDDGRSVIGSPPPMTSLISQLSISHIIRQSKQNVNYNEQQMLSDLSSFQRKWKDLGSVIADPSFLLNVRGTNKEITEDFLTVLHEKYGQKLEFKKRRKRSNPKTENMKRVSSNIHVIDSEGVAVSLTSSLNGEFGAQRLSNRLGFFWNNFMAEFSIGETETDDWNSVQGSKKPRSSLSPIMIMNNGQIESMIGLSTSACFDSIIAQVALNYLLSDNKKLQTFPNSCDLSSSTTESVKMTIKNVNEISLLYKKDNLIYSVCNLSGNSKCSAGF